MEEPDGAMETLALVMAALYGFLMGAGAVALLWWLL
jgi:hypothetical protein